MDQPYDKSGGRILQTEEKESRLSAAAVEPIEKNGAAASVKRSYEEPLFAGVDGGGTKTELLLCRRDGRILARLRTEGCNPNDIGLEPAFAILSSGIRRLLELGGAEEDRVASLFAGLSGGSTGDLQPRINRLLRDAFPQIGQIENGSDAVNILTAGLGAGDGCAVICGTGSACFVRTGGVIRRIGGWGYLLDRYGSGYDIGRDAVIAALRQQDGRGRATLLTRLLEEKLGQPVPAAVSELYRGGKRLLASFAPLVFAAQAAGDQAACDILDRNMEELAGLINAAGRLFAPSSGAPSQAPCGNTPGQSAACWTGGGALPDSPCDANRVQAPGDAFAANGSPYAGAGGGEPFPAVLAGGIFANGKPVMERLTRCITVPAQLRLLEAPPVWGAVFQALNQAGCPLPECLWE